eukprot:1157255-Pelagomonas_calceolata.AAC.5
MLEVEQQQTDLNASHCNQICYHQGAPIQTAMKATHECRDLPGVVAEVHNKSHPASLQLLRLEKAIHCQSMFGGRRHQGPVVENLFAQWCLAGDEPAHGRPNGSIVSPLLRVHQRTHMLLLNGICMRDGSAGLDGSLATQILHVH